MMIHEQKGASGMTIKQSFLACHLAPGIPLSDVSDESALQKIAPQLKAAFETMTSYRISHGDLKANNIIVDDDHKIRFIDLDGTAILSSEKTWADLWKRDRKRFLKNWSEGSFAHQLFSKTMQPA
jgi:RIO-like serine/threonine protein kinase